MFAAVPILATDNCKRIGNVIVNIIIYKTNSNSMATQTLYNLVDTIQVSRIRISRFPAQEVNNAPWTREQQRLFYKLVLDYGADLGLIQSFFPTRTRNQIKRKHRDIADIRRRVQQRDQHRRIRQSRKSYFDDEILEQKLMRWPSKPNNSGDSNTQNSQ